MNLETIKSTLESEKYNFLKTDKHLGSNIIILVVSGSIGYGASMPTSDIDLRGATIELKRTIFGLSTFEQFQDSCTDTVVFGLKKFVKLCLKCNPTALEILGASDNFCIQISPEGQLLRDNIQLFLSKKAIASFGHYAISLLQKLKEGNISSQKLNDMKLGKYAMHVIRILITGKDILEGKGVKIYRDKERDMLMSVRLGAYTMDDFNDLVSQLRFAFDYASQYTELPENPAYDAVEELMMNIYVAHFNLSKKSILNSI